MHIDGGITSRLGRSDMLFMPFRLQANLVAFVSESSSMFQRRESLILGVYTYRFRVQSIYPTPAASCNDDLEYVHVGAFRFGTSIS